MKASWLPWQGDNQFRRLLARISLPAFCAASVAGVAAPTAVAAPAQVGAGQALGQVVAVKATKDAKKFTSSSVTISGQSGGKAHEGEKLTAVPKVSPTPDKISYQWFRNDQKIDGANKATYTAKASDVGKTIKARVTAKKAGYVELQKLSAPVTISAKVYQHKPVGPEVAALRHATTPEGRYGRGAVQNTAIGLVRYDEYLRNPVGLLVEDMNWEREQSKLPPIVLDPELMKYADCHAKELAALNHLTHESGCPNSENWESVTNRGESAVWGLVRTPKGLHKIPIANDNPILQNAMLYGSRPNVVHGIGTAGRFVVIVANTK
ncbi:MAG: hypothetical protein LBB58_05695 [Cellulomonadaceae bacterium]|nr:hypothetical protein [Cellulomonadaceae bacterium]